MAVSNMALARRPFPWRLLLLLAVVAGLVLWFIVHSAVRYISFDATTYTDYYWPRRFGLAPHIAGGVVAILVGLTQLWLGLTGRTGLLHRTLGRIYLAAVAVASAGAYYLALTVGSESFAYASGLFGLASAWIITTSMAYVSIRHRAIEPHREWMIRSYVVAFAFVTFRFFDKPLIAWHVAKDTEVWSMMAFAAGQCRCS
jgi:uncharacterized membrane protein